MDYLTTPEPVFQIIDIGGSYLLFQEDKSGTATVAGDTLTTIVTVSIIQCARKCMIEPKCSTYIYTDANRLCHLFSADTDNMTTTESLTGQAEFKVYNTVQGLYKCPMQNGEWTTAVLTDGSKTRFR
ncbi:hypothetical protein MAR_035473 [Mya arenaria]|uniref:Apple domain-containing protein n=1 Tax=Mya arenaria TaxID=6604 RepID=A0ABY7EMZ8_MYAAR|nr:hypothetical protein MAR_035473 [Mya arenaria]